MSLEITMRHIRALAGKRGYRVVVDDSHLHIIQKSNERVKQSFHIHDPFTIDPSCTQSFPFICAYFWIYGYHLGYEENKEMRRERAVHHPEWNPRHPREKRFLYEGLFLFHVEIAIWVSSLETHHCPFMELL